jgi:hypothetical protein
MSEQVNLKTSGLLDNKPYVYGNLILSYSLSLYLYLVTIGYRSTVTGYPLLLGAPLE